MLLNTKSSLLNIFLFIVLCSLFEFAYSAEKDVAVYVGGGKSSSSNDTAVTLGIMFIPRTDSLIWGADISREGAKLDSTWGRDNESNAATSFNLLVGKSFSVLDNFHADVVPILGARETAESCPRSYLGYKCYADSTPDTKYTFNSGLGVFFSQNKLLLGVRATSVSSQLLIGTKF
jgi:hypothetical protein